MSDYTPTDADIREAFTSAGDGGFQWFDDQSDAAFDRWLAAHDAEVIRQYRIEDYRKRARGADLDWEEFGDVNYAYQRDGYLDMARKLEEEKK